MENKTLENSCNEMMDSIFSQLVSLQDKYKDEDVVEDLGVDEKGNPITRKNKRNKYFQLLETHAATPKDGLEVAEDVDGKTPTDQKETYTDFGLVLPEKMPLSVSVSPYQDDKGWGWTLTGTVIDGADTYQRVLNYGHQVEREQDWALGEGNE